MLSHLVYVSNRHHDCTQQQIEDILAACQRNNNKQDITGVLLYSDNKFIQYLEGEYRQISDLYNKIKLDKRHRNAVLISNGPVGERVFPSWQMGYKKVDLDSIEYKTSITADDRSEFQKVLSGAKSNRSIDVIKKLFY